MITQGCPKSFKMRAVILYGLKIRDRSVKAFVMIYLFFGMMIVELFVGMKNSGGRTTGNSKNGACTEIIFIL